MSPKLSCHAPTSGASPLARFLFERYAVVLDVIFPVGAALTDMIEIMRRYGIMLPPSVAMLIKTLVTLEGTAQLLSPRFSLMEVMQPFHRGMMLRRPYMEVEQLVEILPQRLMQILEQVQDGKFDVHLDHRGLGPSVNRLVLGLLASALFVGMGRAYVAPRATSSSGTECRRE